MFVYPRAGKAARRLLPALFCLPLLLYLCNLILEPDFSLAHSMEAFDKATLNRLYNSLRLAGCMTLFSLGLGLVAYFGAVSLRPRWRAWVMLLALMPLAYPPFGAASGWMTLFTLWETPDTGRILWGAPEGVTRIFFSIPGVALVLALCYWPLVFLLLMYATQPTRVQIEAARMTLPRWTRLCRIYFPAWREPLTVAGAILFCLGMTQFEVPSLMQVDVYPLEIFIRFSALLDEQQGIALTLPFLLLAFLWSYWIQRKNIPFLKASAEPAFRIARLPFQIISIAVFSGILILSCVMPLAGLAMHVRSAELLFTTTIKQADTILNSIGFAAIGGSLIVLSGIWFTSEQSLRARGWAAFMFLFFLCLPGILIASGCLQLRSYWPGRLPWGVQALSMLLAYGIQFFALGYTAGNLLWRSYGQRTEDSDRLFDLHRWQKTRFLYVPALMRPALAAMLLTSLLIWREVPITMLLHPPSRETLALEYYNLLHYGSEPRTAAIGLLMMSLPALALGAGWGLWGRKRDA